MFEDPLDPPPSSDPPPGGSGTGGGAKSINPQDSIKGYTVPEESDSSQESGSTDTAKVMPDSDPPPGGSGTGGGV